MKKITRMRMNLLLKPKCIHIYTKCDIIDIVILKKIMTGID